MFLRISTKVIENADWPNKVNTQAIRVNILQMKLESKLYLGKLGQHKTIETKANKK